MLNFFKKSEPQTLGEIGERLAQLEYAKRGYKIIAANFFNRTGKRLGEVDFIASKPGRIIFVEVKTRLEETGRYGAAAESVNRFKQVKLLKAVNVFLLEHKNFLDYRPQIDVATVIIKQPEQLKKNTAGGRMKYSLTLPLDKLSRFVTIIPNAVEDWN